MWFTALRKELGIQAGKACRWYNNRGIMLIFILPHRPNQENITLPGFEVLFNAHQQRKEIEGGNIIVLFSKRIPRYLIFDFAHLKGKSERSSTAIESGMEMFSASDYW